MNKDTLAQLEHLVLLSVLRLGKAAYGVLILKELADTAHRPTNRAAVYVALRRLDERGLLRSKLAEPTARRGGRAKRFYSVTADGIEALRSQQAMLQRMWAGLESPLGSGGMP